MQRIFYLMKCANFVVYFPFILQECVAKEKEERKVTCKVPREQDDISLFYSDVMPLLVRNLCHILEFSFVTLYYSIDTRMSDQLSLQIFPLCTPPDT